MRIRFRPIALLVIALTAILAPGAISAHGPALVPEPEGFAELRARFEDKSGQEVAAMGYLAEPPVCVSEPELGGMGVHALSFPAFSAHSPRASWMRRIRPSCCLTRASSA